MFMPMAPNASNARGGWKAPDYYNMEDESGQRYWLFRLGHYADVAQGNQWFLHGFFA
jgi:protein ImuB